jgi:hypothetical protein
MNNKATLQDNNKSTYVPAITTIAVPLMLFGRGKKAPDQAATQEAPKKQKKRKPTGQKVGKYEVAEDKIKFYAAKGMFKKRWVVVKEFPVFEVSEPECVGNWLRFKWKDESYSFILPKKTDSFAKLYEQIQAKFEEQQKKRVQNEKAALRKTELLAALNAVLPVVDTSFNILLALHQKRVDWTMLEGYTQAWGAPLSFRAVSLPPLDLDYAKAVTAVKCEAAKETSKETLNILKVVHGYFTGLKPEDDIAEAAPNFEHAKAVVLAYYTLNDLLLAKVVNDKDAKKEAAYLEENLKLLSDTSGFKVEAAAVMAVVNGSGEGVVGEVRGLFLEQLKRF